MASGKRDYYKVLGIGPVAAVEEIRKAYRAASKKYHPDLNPDLKLFSEEKMRELVEAYEVLSDPEKRKEYDKQPYLQLRRSRRSAPQAGPKAKFSANKFKKEDSLLERMFSPFLRKSTNEPQTQLSAKDADLRFTLGLSMAENENFYDRAIEEFQLAVKFDPGHFEAIWNLGILHYRKGHFDEAVVNFQKVLALNNGDPAAKKMIELLRDDYV